MSSIAEQLLQTALQLPLAERVVLRDAIAESCETESPQEPELGEEEWEAAWMQEIERREQNLAAGRSKAVSHEELMLRLQERFG